MKKYLFSILALFAFISTSWAQEVEDKSEQAFRFIYLVHDTSTPVESLIDVLYDVEARTIENGQKCMICLSNGISTKKGEEYLVAIILENSDYEPAFDKIREELRNEYAHDIDINRDVEYIVNLFSKENEFLDENGELLYESMTFDFYLSTQFCDNGYAGQFIAPLYLAFDVPNMPGHFNFNVWVGGKNIGVNDYSDPRVILGDKNYNEINDNIIIMEY